MLLSCCCFAQLLLHLVSGNVAESDVGPLLRRKEFVTLHKWSELKLSVPEGHQQPPTLDAMRYAQDKLLPVDVDVEYGGELFFTILTNVANIAITLNYTMKFRLPHSHTLFLYLLRRRLPSHLPNHTAFEPRRPLFFSCGC